MGYSIQTLIFSLPKLLFCLIHFLVLLLFCFGLLIQMCLSQDVSSPHSCTIHGQVTDKQNNPLQGYIVSTTISKDNVTYAAKTDSGGLFSLTYLPVGTWNVEVRHLSKLLMQREITVVDKTEVDFVIQGTGVVSGFLLDPEKDLPLPITDEIKVAQLANDSKRIKGIYKGKITDGYFEVRHLLPGSYSIVDAFDGYVFAMSGSPKIVVYPQGRVEGVEVYLKKGALVHGTLADTDTSHPISGALVSLVPEKSDSIYSDGTHVHETETNTKGEFRFTTPNDSDTYYAFTVIASHARYQTHRWRQEMIPDKDQYALGELRLKPFLSLRGVVAPAKSNRTVDGFTVRLLMHNRPAEFFRAAAQPDHTVTTDLEGNFLFTQLHPIEYSLTLSEGDVIIAYLESVNPQKNEPILIHLPKLKTLRGEVVDTQQRPISGAQLLVARNSEDPNAHGTILATTQTDKNGTFSLQVLETDPHLLSVDVSKKGYLSRVYPSVKIKKEPLIVTLEKGYAIRGRIIFSEKVPKESYYDVKVFSEETEMTPTLDPMSLNRPIMSKRFGVTDHSFVLDGLFAEQYTLYITGENFGATGINVKATPKGDEVFVVVDIPTTTLKGEILWTETDEPVKNAMVLRSWYPWDLNRYDMSLTLDRFETETDDEGRFSFSDLTQERYQLYVRAVYTEWNDEIEKYRRVYTQKQVEIPICSDNIHRIYLGREDGTAFTK